MRARPVRWRTWLALAATALVLATLATAKGGDPALWPPSPDAAVTVYLVDNGFHTDVALPREALGGGLAGRAADAVTARPWVAVGWGDERFFIEQGVSVHRLLDGLRALFAPNNPSAVRIDGLSGRPDLVYRDGVRAVRLSPAGLRRLTARIDASLVANAAGSPLAVPAPPAADAGYFRSRETFSLLHLCNHWTAELLSAAGLPTTPVLDTLPAGLNLDLKLRAGA